MKIIVFFTKSLGDVRNDLYVTIASGEFEKGEQRCAQLRECLIGRAYLFNRFKFN